MGTELKLDGICQLSVASYDEDPIGGIRSWEEYKYPGKATESLSTRTNLLRVHYGGGCFQVGANQSLIRIDFGYDEVNQEMLTHPGAYHTSEGIYIPVPVSELLIDLCNFEEKYNPNIMGFYTPRNILLGKELPGDFRNLQYLN